MIIKLLPSDEPPLFGGKKCKLRALNNVTFSLLTRFYLSHIKKNALSPGNCTINVNLRVLTWKNAPPPGRPEPILNTDIIRTNILTKFHEDWTIIHTIQLIQDIIEKNILTIIWTINLASIVLTRQMLTTLDTQQTKGDHKSLP
ncbi:hypothetical protein DPMN_026097 [Dreissena polymorpha]|uniref:Uncharacterized protein n=1 Tax=Dreissena polymorpha TaxID=45954 RepID=A0A9D4LSS4_DREPO|nr:hypothetical protein DPMN_026097 [Dreissena polymorpha]